MKKLLPLLSILVICGCTTSIKPEIKPNVVFILVDDLGWSDLSYNGSTIYETPSIDQLAKEGVVYDNFYTAGPVCSPTRASILTGKFPVKTGVTTYLISPELDVKYIENQLNLSEFTIAEAFQKGGYKTGYIGKWHLGYKKEHWAAEQGFEVAIGGMDNDRSWRLAHPDKPQPNVDEKKGHLRFFSPHKLTFMEDGPEGEYLTDRLTDETIKFIEENQNERFFVFLSFHTVHTPLQVKEEKMEKYTEKIRSLGLLENDEMSHGSRLHQNLPQYAAMVEHMDENVGRLLDKIKSLNLEENTIIVFTSDNGGKNRVTSNAPLKGAKHDLYEGGVRTPLIVKWKGKTKANSTSHEVTVSTDFYPTLLDLAGLPQCKDQHQDGVSFKENLLNVKKIIDRDAIYWHYPHGVFQGAIRMGDYKLIVNYKSGQEELFNLANDIGEHHNLATAEPDVHQKLRVKLKEWLIAVDANFPSGFTPEIMME
jgi:arylsulfatase A-like enzyme